MKKNIFKSGVLVFGLMFVFVGNVFAGAIYDNGTNVGIGTTNPQSILDVVNDGHSNIRIDSGINYQSWLLFSRGGQGKWAISNGHTGDALTFYDYANAKVRMLINTDGNIGIGIANPTARFEINDKSNLRFAMHTTNPYIKAGTGQNIILGDRDTDVMTIKHNGNVGIGTTNPQSILDIVNERHSNIRINSGINYQSWLLFSRGGQGKWAISNGHTGDALTFYDYANAKVRMLINTAGNVGIGTTPPKPGYKLTVNGGIYAESIRVRNDVAVNTLTLQPKTWSDFVFEDDYNLMPLAEVENKIKKQKHLPGIPSEAEVKKNGVSVGEMQAKLLQKIEELTLYVIELKKENETQSQEIEGLKSRVDSGQVVTIY
ncbi:hypothetical protein ACFL2K_03950 [Candidatus Margulisiibacteriota bacterium]